MSSTGTRPALVLQHGPLGPPALLGEWLQERAIPYVVHHVHEDLSLPAPDEYRFVASLGSAKSPSAQDDPEVAAELALLRRAVDRDVPVLGLCFGGQALAQVLGGRVEPSPIEELGWHRVETAEPETVAAGPWLQWHYERFTLPPRADELARSAVGPQAFRHGVHVGTQFHPESTMDVVAGWARHDAERLAARGIADGEALVFEGREHADAAREAAFRLFDAFARRAGVLDPA
jgi:GMP synthase-like glutamine amidotransferase